MARDIAFSCSCGAVTGKLEAVGPSAGTRLNCHCNDCAAVVQWFGAPDPAPDGVAYFQVTPDRIVFETGEDTVKALSWRRPTVLRWYAACCASFLFNTPGTPKVPFASFCVSRTPTPEALGRVSAEVFIPSRDGKTRHKGAIGLAWSLLSRTAAARFSGRWRDTPFFDPGTLKPKNRPRRLTADERAMTAAEVLARSEGAPVPDAAS